MRRLFCLLAALFALGTSASAAIPIAEVTLVAEEESIAPGRPFWLAVQLNVGKGWHSYWKNPGDAGAPIRISWTAPDGFSFGPIRWPTPERFEWGSAVGFGYEGKVTLLVQVEPPVLLPLGQSVTLTAHVNWVACADECVPDQKKVTLMLPVSSSAPILSQAYADLFLTTRSSLPERPWVMRAERKGRDIVLNFCPDDEAIVAYGRVSFFPEDPQVIDLRASQELTELGHCFSLKMASGPGSPTALKGILYIQKGAEPYGRETAVEVDLPLAASPVVIHAVAQSLPEARFNSLGLALLFALCGGLILNLMPCVLPVVSLKVLGFIRHAQEHRTAVLAQGVAFVIGVLLSFWILAGTLLLLRDLGQAVGWGFQLQNPIFVAVLAGLLFLLGLSLFGLFELRIGLSVRPSHSGLAGAFFNGILATIVATPCTGPLLGPALGFAATLPLFSALSIFTAMGFGMALPYLILSAFPGLLRWLPRPGGWMITFKEVMGFLMMATVVWLLWVFGAQTDLDGVTMLLIAFIVLAAGAWAWGHWIDLTRRRSVRLVAALVALISFVLAFGGIVEVAARYSNVPVSAEQGEEPMSGAWEPFSPERLDALRAAGKPVFVDFTARWCLICQVNKAVLYAPEVEKKFEELGVTCLRADWTRKDPIITQVLEQFGRNGVPLYLLYGCGAGAPDILPQQLTRDDIIERLETVCGKK